MRPQRHHLANPALGLGALPAQDRLRVLTAATEVFATHGYRATTTEHLQFQFDPFAFDSLFADKEDCFLQAHEHHTARARDAIAASAPIDDSWPRRFAAGLWTLLQLIDAEPSSARLVLVEAQAATPTITRHFLETVYSAVPFMREGRLQADEKMPALVDSVLPGGVAGALAAHLIARREAPASSLYRELLRPVFAYYPDNPEVASVLATETLGEPA
jgi:AcrR family transcriptional regulator